MNCKILHVCGRLKGGGITRFVSSLLSLNGTTKTQHDLLLTFASEPLEVENVECHHLNYSDRNMLACLRAVRSIYARYDVIMIHGAHPVVVLPLLTLRKKCFLFQHGMSVTSGSSVKRAIKKGWFGLLPVLLRAQVVCSTEYAFEKANALGIRLRRKNTSIIPFGTQLDLTRRPPPERNTSPAITIGMAARMVAQKRMDLPIRSLASYNGSHTIHLKIAGDGPDRAHLESLADFQQDRVIVEFLGHVEDMEAFYRDIDLFLFPSRGESFGLVVLEAFNRTLPVAVFPDVGGCLPLIRDGENGFILSEGLEGLKKLWAILDADSEILFRQRMYIATMDLSRFDIAHTKSELEHLAGCAVSAN